MINSNQPIAFKENMIIESGLILPDSFTPKGKFILEVFHVKKTGSILIPELSQEFENAIVNTGGAQFLDAFIGAGGLTAFSNANAHIGVGNGTAAVAVAQTDLQGASKTRKAMEATFPSRSGQIMTFRSVFGTGDANYSWEEMALFNAAAAGVMACRALVASPFTKTSALSITSSYLLQCP